MDKYPPVVAKLYIIKKEKFKVPGAAPVFINYLLLITNIATPGGQRCLIAKYI
jgi:hypothetical protein